MGKKLLFDYNNEELSEKLVEFGEKKYRSAQILKWLYDGVASTDEMTNIPITLRKKINDCFYFKSIQIEKKYVSKIDNTIKYVLRLNDGNVIECVLMEYKYGYSLCISCQVGCRMGCTFCASSNAGFDRNLSPGEMVEQVIRIQNDKGIKIRNVVIMGIGEPFDNYKNVMKFVEIANAHWGLNIGARKITISTCGILPGIIRFAKEKSQVNLSISLHAPNDKVRNMIMPVNNKYSIDKIIRACKIYTRKTNRRITFEYALIKDVNDTIDKASELAQKIKGILCYVNLIVYNKIEKGSFDKSDLQRAMKFRDILMKKGIETTIRRELGCDINAACGQLRATIKSKK